MKIMLMILVVGYGLSFAGDEPEVIAISNWSKKVAGKTDGDAAIRGRLVILQGHEIGDASELLSTMVYVELQNMGLKPAELYFDGTHGGDFRPEYKGGLNCDLFDSQGKPVPSIGGGGSGIEPASEWITMPSDSTIRLRANHFAIRSPREGGLVLPFPGNWWMIKAQDTNHYFLSASFTAIAPTNHVSEEVNHGRRVVWDGMLKFPKVDIALKPR
jgi:hypothetical protein